MTGKAKVIISQSLQVSHEMTVHAHDPASLMVEMVERYRRHIPDRVYGLDHRIVRVVAEPPWDLYEVGRGGNHMDPLQRMDTYLFKWASSNISPLSKAERKYAESIMHNVPEGGLLPEGFGAHVYRESWPRTLDFPTYMADLIRGQVAQRVLQQQIVKRDAGIKSGTKALQELIQDLKAKDTK